MQKNKVRSHEQVELIELMMNDKMIVLDQYSLNLIEKVYKRRDDDLRMDTVLAMTIPCLASIVCFAVGIFYRDLTILSWLLPLIVFLVSFSWLIVEFINYKKTL